ncbi:hypothetical protein Syun_021110 [Stephania yunnanensis]|uniref:Uncharacterized protein n=1 Tax=Stephania yunnanensis TaxID=152371 RepID=A0AAP0IF72_9MAGN
MTKSVVDLHNQHKIARFLICIVNKIASLLLDLLQIDNRSTTDHDFSLLESKQQTWSFFDLE